MCGSLFPHHFDIFAERRAMEYMMGTVGWGLLSVVVVAWLWRVVDWVYWTPRRLERALRAQGLKGTRYRLFSGDVLEEFRLGKEVLSKPLESFSHSIIPRVSPFLNEATKQYGKICFTWFGPTPRVNITDPELIREIMSNKFGHFEIVKLSKMTQLLASGLLMHEGEKWAKHRKIINPAFHQEKLKLMMPAFSICCDELIARWEKFAATTGSCELDVWPEIQNFTGDVISRTAFGSSYAEGKRIFQLQIEQAQLLIQSIKHTFIPGYRFLPTTKNIRIKAIYKEIRAILKSMIESREKTVRLGDTSNDLLGLLMESNSKQSEEMGNTEGSRMTTNEVIEECKLFYFAGQETTSSLITWTMILLSMNPNWQARAREEIFQVFGKNKPNFNGLSHLKIVTMIIYEVLRLYPAFIMLQRKMKETVEVGGITLPKGVLLALQILFIQHDPELWGEDVDQFNPERFSDGVSKASKDKMALLSFGWGPRICIGQSFAMLEAKMGLSTILQNFSLEISPSYIHSPRTVFGLQPQHGAQIILHKL